MKLCERLKNEPEFTQEPEIPPHISENLGKNLREYQTDALKHFFLQRKNPQTNHLMFNMATGSGKTLIMAALILDAFKNGYDKFIFFVNSTNILEKTKANFADQTSPKHLFSPDITLEGKKVEINVVENFSESREGDINICFTTVQSLFSLLTQEKENSITFDDLKEQKLVFLADEAHHLNADTKKKKEYEKDGWEGVVKRAFEANDANLMFEFTATIPQIKEIQEKYEEKIVFEYTLKQFCEAGFSKKITLVRHELDELKTLFLSGVVLNIFRQEVAQKHGITLKPVVLFKSASIANSKKNQTAFCEFVKNLTKNEVVNFFKSVSEESELLFKAKKFFENREFELTNLIKENFKSEFLLNANDDKETEKNQILLNSLENENNFIRAIFAVNKLDEGWDVLNLFDIVRLDGSDKKSTAQAQLIGRGARYFPFEFGEKAQDKRKFDTDATHELSALEVLAYHSYNDVGFIEELNRELISAGLKDKNEKKLTLTPRKGAENAKTVRYAKNRCVKKENSLLATFEPKFENALEIPLFSSGVSETKVEFEELKTSEPNFRNFKFGTIVNLPTFLKACNVLGMSFESLKGGFKSRREFYEALKVRDIWLDRAQNTGTAKTRFSIAKFVLQQYKKTQKEKSEFEGSEFFVATTTLKEREIFTTKEVVEKSYEWLYYDKFLKDSELEVEFLKFVEANKERLSEKFKEWFVVRNDGFDEFKLYNFENGKGFEPDFLLFGRDESGESGEFECIFEAKGEDRADNKTNKWKEEFLALLDGKTLQKSENGFSTEKLNLKGFPFFKKENNAKFKEKFEELCEKEKGKKDES